MKTEIYPVKLGIETSFIIKGDGVILIDAGTPGKLNKFLKAIKKAGISPGDIKLIVLTHAHWDHIGSLNDIKHATGAKVLIHSAEKDWIEKPLKPLPPGFTCAGKIFVKFVQLIIPFIKIQPTEADITFEDEFSLHEYGIPGKIIHTPGHSPGSSTVILDSGDIFSGDMAMNTLPLRVSPNIAALGYDMQLVIKSWEKILEFNPMRVYPAHGKPFPAEIIRGKIKKHAKLNH